MAAAWQAVDVPVEHFRGVCGRNQQVYPHLATGEEFHEGFPLRTDHNAEAIVEHLRQISMNDINSINS